MKKAVALIIVLSMLASLSIFSHATECEHSYTPEEIPATCTSRAKTVFTCSLCGDTYETSSPLFTAPDGMYLLLEGDYDGSTLTMRIYLYNNPGMYASNVTVGFNSAALTAVSLTNGTIWTDDQVSSNIKSNAVRYFGTNSELGDIYTSGLLFTVSFEVHAAMSEWNLIVNNVASADKCFINYDVQALPITLVNTVTAGYGDHIWSEEGIRVEPTLDTEGTVTRDCTLCPAKHVERIPVLERWIKGDLDHDTKVNATDLIYLKFCIMDSALFYGSLQMIDAADIDNNGKINSVDVFQLKLLLLS